MSKAKFIQENGETILPITHEEAVLDNDGKNLPSKYQQKQDENLLTDSKTIVGAINELSTKGGGDGTITSVPYTEGSDLDIEQIGGGGSVGEITTNDVKLPNSNTTLSEELLTYDNWIQGIGGIAQANQDKIGETELATTDKTLTGAINELFQSANNGKELIADAIGEPLDASDTFSAMSTDINSLLSTFKTNMMNSGVVVEGSDRFKQLIDKIATMVEEGSGKGIRYATGSITPTYISSSSTYKITVKLDFKPSVVVFLSSTYYVHYNEHISTSKYIGFNGNDYNYSIPGSGYVNDTGFSFELGSGFDGTYYAIGVGEEDTTLRDSLASILQDSGVEVTEEDDMASLISKVDAKLDNSGGLDIISATELPATGKEGQICIITDNPVDNYIITSDKSDFKSSSINILLASYNPILGYTVTKNNMIYNINKIWQQDKPMNSFIYHNNIWNKCTTDYLPLITNKVPVNNDYFGTVPAGNWKTDDTGFWTTGLSNYPRMFCCFNKKINFSYFYNVDITFTYSHSQPFTLAIGACDESNMNLNTSKSNTLALSEIFGTDTYVSLNLTPTENVEATVTFDISSLKGECPLGIIANINSSSRKLTITGIRFY